MDRVRFLFVALLFVLMSLPTFVAAAHRLGGFCPFDNTLTTWTGRTEIVNGQTWYVMQCTQGHRSLSPNP